MVFLDKFGWPVERVNGHKVSNFIRLLIHTRKIVRGRSVASATDSSNFVRKLNKDGTKFEKLGGGWGKLVGPRTGSYGQN